MQHLDALARRVTSWERSAHKCEHDRGSVRAEELLADLDLLKLRPTRQIGGVIEIAPNTFGQLVRRQIVVVHQRPQQSADGLHLIVLDELLNDFVCRWIAALTHLVEEAIRPFGLSHCHAQCRRRAMV